VGRRGLSILTCSAQRAGDSRKINLGRGNDVKGRNRVVLAKQSKSIDLEFCMFDIDVGKTYEDDQTTVFDVYIEAGLRDGSFEEVARRSDTILVHHPDA
jgi:hypothetical protein